MRVGVKDESRDYLLLKLLQSPALKGRLCPDLIANASQSLKSPSSHLASVCGAIYQLPALC